MQQSWGIIGVGELGASLVEGLCRSESPPRLLLSPRGESRVRELVERFSVEIAANNQAVVDRADHVIVAVQPHQLLDVATSLEFRRAQVVVSVAAAVEHAAIADTLGAGTAVRAMPVLSAAAGDSPTCIYPAEPVATGLFERLGPVHAFDNEREFETAAVAAMYYAWVYALIEVSADWLADNGVAASTGHTLVAQMTRAAAARCLASDQDTATLLAEITPPGSFSAAGLDLLRERRALDAWGDACATVLAACRGRGHV